MLYNFFLHTAGQNKSSDGCSTKDKSFFWTVAAHNAKRGHRKEEASLVATFAHCAGMQAHWHGWLMTYMDNC